MTLRRVTSLELVHIVKDDLVTDFPSILARWRNHFSQLLNVYGVNIARQTEIYTAEPERAGSVFYIFASVIHAFRFV
jgi:hypothetical protein